MSGEHPNVKLMQQLDPSNLAAAGELFAPDVVFHYFQPKLPDIEGDYLGLDGIRSFFESIGAHTGGTFKVEPVSLTAVGDELVVAQTKNRMTIEGQAIAVDVVVVWRIVDGRIAEIWDIPSAYTQAKA